MPTTCFWNKLHQVCWKLKVTHIRNNIDNKHTLSVTQRSNGHGSIAVIWFKKMFVLLIVCTIVIFLGNWSLLTSYEQIHSFYVLLYCRTINQSLEKSSDSEINSDTGNVHFSNLLVNIWDTITQINLKKNGHHGISTCLDWNETNIPRN